jgi:glucose-6-phosphate isomerase
MAQSLIETPEWRELAAHQREAAAWRIDELFAADGRRFDHLSLALDGLLADYSRHLVTHDTLKLLLALARARDVPVWIERLFSGVRVNHTENRAALHTALRSAEAVMLDGADVAAAARAEAARFLNFAESVRAAGKITDVVNIGIGGSYLGPQLACAALRPYADGRIRAHFVSNVDGENLAAVLAALDPARTLLVITSKTFTTQETMANAQTARVWLTAALGADVSEHLCAVSADPARATAFGVPRERVFQMYDWVGGRYSLWSAVGLPVALYAGAENFRALLAGARAMDEHFRHAPLEQNLPVMLALLDVWYTNFLGAQTHAVVPYAHALARLPAYLQQLEMESLGKRVTRDGAPMPCDTGNVVWGEPGSDAQHSFFQLLHQGTRLVPVDLIAACRTRGDARQHQLLLANFFAQGRALAAGAPGTTAHETLPGNRPSTSLLFDELDARALGQLLALYEHKVFVQSVIWDINAFDQWGVALGKRIADEILPAMRGAASASGFDAATNGLINYYKAAVKS